MNNLEYLENVSIFATKSATLILYIRMIRNMIKMVVIACCTAAMMMLTACTNSDDDEIFGTGLTGKWDLVEVQNGPAGFCKSEYTNKYPSGSVIIRISGNGKIVFNYEDGKVETLNYTILEDQEKYSSTLPIMIIGDVPFGFAVEGNSLKLHYCGFYFCDHIPATFVFKRTK